MKNLLFTKVIMPWNNLGCLAISNDRVYADIFLHPYFGLYIHNKQAGTRKWYKLPVLRLLRRQA